MLELTIGVDHYLAGLPDERRAPVSYLRETLANNLPDGFEETCAQKPAYVVPLARLPDSSRARNALPFMAFANLKSYVALYHFGLAADPPLLLWFQQEYLRSSRTLVDMGKRCIRFRKPEQIPFDLIAELARQRSVDDWIAQYYGMPPAGQSRRERPVAVSSQA